MLLNAKKMAFLGLLLAVTSLFIILSGVLEFNTLFLLGAASFGVGIAIRESNVRYGTGFYLGAILIGLILAPNKLYCITFAAMGLYIIVIEYSFDKLVNIQNNKKRIRLYWMIKYITFNLMYLPMLLFLPRLIYQGKINPILVLILILAGQVVLFVYDLAYNYFQRVIWSKLRNKLTLS